jgi:hypothetical protein
MLRCLINNVNSDGNHMPTIKLFLPERLRVNETIDLRDARRFVSNKCTATDAPAWSEIA